MTGALLIAMGLAAGAAGILDAGPVQPLDLRPDAATRLLVIAPHPDDEALGAAGLIQRVLAAGGSVRVVMMTSGDAFPEGVEAAMHIRRPRPRDFRSYGSLRERETTSAMQRLGLNRSHVLFLGFPDGGLCLIAANYLSSKARAFDSPYTRRNEPPVYEQLIPGVRYRGADIRRELERILVAYQPTVVAVPHPEDEHPEHCSTNIFLREALEAVQTRYQHVAPRVLQYLIHYKQWPLNLASGTDTPLQPPADFPRGEGEWRALTLTPEEAAVKRRVLGDYPSQQLVIGGFIQAFERTNELFLEGRPASAPECWCDEKTVATELPPAEVPPPSGAAPVKVASHHVESLDVFRGATVAAMILVNNPGDWSFVFGPLLHAYWLGCTFADLVFPWFIFIMGVAMPYAFARRRAGGAPIAHVHRRIVQRAAILIVLGLLLTVVSAWPAVLPLRLPGVLQRIALSYLFAAFIVLHTEVSGWAIAAAGLLAAHWALLALVPFGGFSGGTLLPDHNLARYLDTLVFGRHALTIPNDPEGLLGTLTATATALLGALCGEMMRRAASHAARTRRLLAAGTFFVAAGILWSRVLPLSKPLWTGSYVLYVTGLGMLVLAVTYFVVDVRGVRAWARPFLWLGVNPLAIYVLSEVAGHLIEKPWVHQAAGVTTAKASLFWRFFVPAVPAWPFEWVSLAFGLCYAGLWMFVAGLLYRRRVRIQV